MRSVGVGDFGSDPARLLLAQSPEGLFEPAIAPRSNADAARELGRLRRSSTLCQCGRWRENKLERQKRGDADIIAGSLRS